MTWRIFRQKMCKKLGVEQNARGYGVETIRKAMRPIIQQKQLDILDPERTKSTES